MKDLPAHQLDPKVKTAWRINDAIWLTVVFLCCFVPFAIVQVDPASGCSSSWSPSPLRTQLA